MESKPVDLAALRERIAPVTLAGEQRLPVPVDLAALFPAGGLPTGWSVGVNGSARWTVAARLMAAAAEQQRWVALVGAEEFGLVAAQEQGLPLDRVLLVEHPEPAQWPTVIAALIEAVGIVAINPTTSLPRGPARRLSARLRECRGVLVHLDGGRAWPEPLEITLEAAGGRWEGLGWGHGLLRNRPITVTAEGRRSVARSRRVEMVA